MATAAIGIGSAPTASAYSTVGKFGAYERLYDADGAVVTARTVSDLEPSRDTVPDYRWPANSGRQRPPSKPSGAA